MARVAANQDRSESARARYVYLQHARVISRHGKTIQCEEVTDTRVAPGASGSEQLLLKLEGRRLVKKRYVTYHELRKPDEHNGGDKIEVEDGTADQDLVENLRKNLTNEKSKDGLNAGLFPLTLKAQSQYHFELKGRERRNGRDTFHIAFTPTGDSFGWKGDAWIDAEKFQPLAVQTALGHNVPFAVRTLLGTSVPGLGFSVTYAEQADGVWFPVSFGSEFKINVLFFYHRQMTFAIDNRDFQKTHVESRIVAVPTVADTPGSTTP